MFKRVGSVFPNRLIGQKSAGPLAAIQIRLIAKEVISKNCEDLGEEILRSIKPSIFKNGTLTISCPPLVSSDLQMRSEGLIKGINARIGRRVVEGLRFKVF